MDSPRDVVTAAAATAPGASFVVPPSSPTHPVTPLATAAIGSATAKVEPKAPSALRWYHVVGIAVGVTLVVAGIALAILTGVIPGITTALGGLTLLTLALADLHDAQVTAKRKFEFTLAEQAEKEDSVYFKALKKDITTIFGIPETTSSESIREVIIRSLETDVETQIIEKERLVKEAYDKFKNRDFTHHSRTRRFFFEARFSSYDAALSVFNIKDRKLRDRKISLATASRTLYSSLE